MTAPEQPLPSKSETEPDEQDSLVKGVRLHGERHQRSLREGTPSVARQLAMIGVLGWIIVVPMLVGLFVGHWLDGWIKHDSTFLRRFIGLGRDH